MKSQHHRCFAERLRPAGSCDAVRRRPFGRRWQRLHFFPRPWQKSRSIGTLRYNSRSPKNEEEETKEAFSLFVGARLAKPMAFSRPSLMARGVRQPRMFSSRRSSPYTLALTILLVLSVVLLMLLALGIFSLPVNSDSTPEAADIRRVRSVHEKTMTDGNGLGNREAQWTEVISWEPRAFIFHNFLSKEECEYLINLAKPRMEKSTVVDSATGKSKDSRVRTSSGTFLQRGRDKIIREIEKRISDYTFLPVEYGEGLQVLHYEVGQKYEPHFDYFLDEFNTKNGGQRMATLLMYLSDVEEGGETVFPSAKVNSSSLPWFNELSECGKKGLSVKPKMGDALLFWSMKPDAALDPLSLHGGCPVIKGNKWSATKWIRVHEYKV